MYFSMAYVRMWSECHVICRRTISQRPVDSIVFSIRVKIVRSIINYTEQLAFMF